MDARLGFGTRLRWFCDRFVTVGFGENEHFAIALALAAMWINLIGMSDVNSDSSDTDSASVAMPPTATLL